MFWLCKFIFGSHPHYAVKLVYFWLAIKIFDSSKFAIGPYVLGPSICSVVYFAELLEAGRFPSYSYFLCSQHYTVAPFLGA